MSTRVAVERRESNGMRKAVAFVCIVALATLLGATTAEDNFACGAPPPAIQGATTDWLEGSEYPLGSSITYYCPLGNVGDSIFQDISFCKIDETTGEARWIVPEITCNSELSVDGNDKEPKRTKPPKRKRKKKPSEKNSKSLCKVPVIENGCMERSETRSHFEEFQEVPAEKKVDSDETLILRCKEGFLPFVDAGFLRSNRLEVTCSEGVWSRDLQCKQASCPGEPPVVENAKPVVYTREHGYAIYYRCNSTKSVKVHGNVTCHFGSWIGNPPKCLDNEEKDKSIPTTEAGSISPGTEIQPSVNEESSDNPVRDVESNKECFCTYDYENDSIKARIGHKILKQGDTIAHGERVAVQCDAASPVLTWKNGLRIFSKAYMTCSSCERWQSKDLPTCNIDTRSDAVIGFGEDLNILPGGIVGLNKDERRRFVCSSSWRQPRWDYGPKTGMFETRIQVPGDGGAHFISLLDILEVEEAHNGRYECFVQDDHGQRVGSTFLHLRVNESDIRCPRIDDSENFVFHYSNRRRMNSNVIYFCLDRNKSVEGCDFATCLANGTWSCTHPTCVAKKGCSKFPDFPELQVTYTMNVSVGSVATFSCSSPTRDIIGSSVSVCQENGSWSNPLPSCQEPKCSIHDLSVSLPDVAEVDMHGVKDEFLPLGTEVGLQCSGKSVINGNSKAQCGKHGKWELGNIQCHEGCVLNLDPSSQLVVVPMMDIYHTGDSILLSCPPDKKMSKRVKRIICLIGRWSDFLPECK